MSDWIVGFENCHRHTEYSVLDGYAKVEEYAKRSGEINQRFLCITDHGAMGAIPRQIKACEKYGISPIYGCELYCHPDQPEVKPGELMADYTSDLDSDEKKKLLKSYHLLAIAYNEVGYSNLVQLSSWGWTRGYYKKPRVNHEQLLKHKEGIIFTSCCYMSEIGQAFDRGGDDEAFDMVEKYYGMFGDNFYLEIMLLDFEKQKPYDVFILKAHDRYGIPLIVTTDCHYCLQEDSKMQRLMLMINTGRTLNDIDRFIAEGRASELFELQDQNLWMKSEEEINEKWKSDYSDVIDYELLKQAKMNTVAICERAKDVKLDRSIKLPQLEDADDKLQEAILEGFLRRRLPQTTEYKDRLAEEYDLICKKKFSSYFLMQKMMTDEARSVSPKLIGYGDGSEAVGPGRGSGVAALTNFCLGVTDVDPIQHDLLFSRFLSPARGGLQMRIRFNGKPISNDIVGVEKLEEIEEAPF